MASVELQIAKDADDVTWTSKSALIFLGQVVLLGEILKVIFHRRLLYFLNAFFPVKKNN